MMDIAQSARDRLTQMRAAASGASPVPQASQEASPPPKAAAPNDST
jgi:hypothetical protein